VADLLDAVSVGRRHRAPPRGRSWAQNSAILRARTQTPSDIQRGVLGQVTSPCFVARLPATLNVQRVRLGKAGSLAPRLARNLTQYRGPN
jgi:hypothetical protein